MNQIIADKFFIFNIFGLILIKNATLTKQIIGKTKIITHINNAPLFYLYIKR